MLIIRKPKDISKYIYINDFHLNFYLQRKDYHPRYYDGDFYYYDKTEQLQTEIMIYNTIQKESEVSEFGKNL
jgi:hypothetical protein